MDKLERTYWLLLIFFIKSEIRRTHHPYLEIETILIIVLDGTVDGFQFLRIFHVFAVYRIEEILFIGLDFLLSHFRELISEVFIYEATRLSVLLLIFLFDVTEA